MSGPSSNALDVILVMVGVVLIIAAMRGGGQE